MSKSESGDPRLANRKDQQNDPRQDRAATDRPVTERREMSDEERLEAFRNTSFQHTLPETGKLAGYHLCWLTTQNPRDSIATRTRWGYSPVRPEELPEYEFSTVKTGEYAGCVGVNEMVLFKIPQHLYEMYMKEMHHEGPLKEEKKLSAVLEVIASEARAHGAHVEMGDGSATLGKQGRRPIFEEV